MVASGQSITAEPPPPPEAPPPVGGGDRLSRYGTALLFLAPAVVMLGVWVLYPTVYTIIRSLFDRAGSDFVWFDNYKTLWHTDILRKSILRNLVWVAIVPALVTSLGLIYAVLTERVRWSVAFKTALFMPMAISLFATGVIWRIMDDKDPNRGAVNATIGAFHDWVSPPGPLKDAFPSTATLVGSSQQGFRLQKPIAPGGTALLGLTGFAPEDMPAGAKQAVVPKPKPGAIDGTVWRDFKPGGGVPGKVEKSEVGIPNVKVQLLDPGGKKIATATTADDGTFEFTDLKGGSYGVGVDKATFAKPFDGVSWLGTKLITPAVMVAYIWVWAGFALVVIAAGLAAIPRDVLEAARTDGGTEWQVFRRVTVPLLAPVLSVVFITMLINVLKVFDIVLSVAPGSSQDAASVIAVSMWRTAFGGVNDFGLGSAVAVVLFLLVIPVLALNIRRFKREV